jgi:hypothetical protein
MAANARSLDYVRLSPLSARDDTFNGVYARRGSRSSIFMAIRAKG